VEGERVAGPAGAQVASVDGPRGGRAVVYGLLACLVVLAACVSAALRATPARAAVAHAFLPEISKALAHGVPETATSQEAAIMGPLESVNALTVDSGHVWIADRVEGVGTRVDKFDANSGEFLPPQLREEGGASFFESGVAVGHVLGEEQVYAGAGKEGESVVAVFGPTGELQAIWTGANTPNKSFSNRNGERIAVITGVAVDSSSGKETSGDVYVATNAAGVPESQTFDVVNVFSPVAGGAEPAEATAQIRGPETPCVAGQPACVNPLTEEPCKEESGVSETGCVSLFSAPTGVAVSGFNGDVLVTDRFEGVDVFEPTVLGQYVFVQRLTGAPTGHGSEEAPFGQVSDVAVDGANGDIYVVDEAAGTVDQFNAAGEYLGRLTGTPAGPFSSLSSVAVDPADGHVFVRDFDPEGLTGPVDVFGPNIVIPDVTTSAATGVSVSAEGSIKAVLHGAVNPDGAGDASCRFAWGPTGAFGQVAPCEPETIPNGEADVPVHAQTEGLEPDTNYVFRLQASNANGTNPGQASQNETLTTPGPGIHTESVSSVTSDSATLEASIDPHGAPTSYYFQYGGSNRYEISVPAPPGNPLGEGEADVPASEHLQGLKDSTLYHYRVVAVSELDVEGTVKPVTFTGPDKTFTTHAASGAAVLPDGRQWEQVSPVDKHGAFLFPISGTGVMQAATSGGAVSYLASVPTEEGSAGNRGGVQILSSRGAGSWSSQDIQLSHPAAAGGTGSAGHEYRFFTEDLSLALVEPLGDFASLAPQSFPPDTERTPYIRHSTTCATSSASCFEPLLTSAPGYANVPEGTQFGGGTGLTGQAYFVGATPDLSHVVLSSEVALTATPVSTDLVLYERSAGKAPSEQLQLVSVLPGGEPASNRAFLGSHNRIARHAISDDGSRIVWANGEVGHLYMRDTAKGQTLQLDVPEAKCLEEQRCGSGEVNPRFQLASRDGSRIFFTAAQRLTEDSGARAGEPDLYVCEVKEAGGQPACKLTDLTPLQGETANVQGKVMGASDDGSWVYYVANGTLASGAIQGKCLTNVPSPVGARCNIYVSHYDGTGWQAPSLVAVISGDDFPDWGGKGELSRLTARVSPNGQWAAFMSDLGLTGNDTRDAVSGQPDEEVYLYHAEAEGSGSLACASCDPSGARPTGVESATISGRLAGGDEVWNNEQWIAANIPGWTPYTLATALYQSRYLSDQGRLFFNSSDALVPRDVNGDEDIYEFEPAGVGGCAASATGFNAATGGCVGLVSSGRAAGESAFLDASESGDDVFFLTGGQLVASDSDTAVDLYDAHVCSALAPCFSQASPPPLCTTADSCRSAPSPQPQIFGHPSSATFSGAGNIVPAPPRPAVLTRAQKLKRALKACRALKAKHRRVACERRARKRYGSKRRHARGHNG
jgi:hypothetical protein